MMPVQDYDESDSENEQIDFGRGKQYSDSEDEVLGVGVSDEDDDDEESNIAASDIDGQDDDDIPNIHAWGKDKRKYYSTDYVDPDYGGYQGKDAALADQEEEEAAILHKELAQKLDEDVFALDIVEKKVEDKKVEEVTETDISKLSKRQKIQLLEKESPEFFGLIEEYKLKNALLNEYLQPILELTKKGKIKDCDAVTFIATYQHLISSYSTCIVYYLLLKSSRKNVLNHPVIKRLNQFRQLIIQMQPVFEETVKPQIEVLLQEHKDAELVEEVIEKSKKSKKKTLKLLQKLVEAEKPQKNKKGSYETEPPKKRQKLLEGGEVESDEEESDINKVAKEKCVRFEGNSDEDSSEDGYEKEQEEAEEEEEVGNARRPITYEIKKNKGLTPYRKKEQRNPRVKYKNKFRKATIRRKGAVRSVRPELSRYGGEISGIKTTVSKSIKLKS